MGFYKYLGDGFVKKIKLMEFLQDLKILINVGSFKFNVNFQGIVFEEMNIVVKFIDKEGKFFDFGKYFVFEYIIYILNLDKVVGKIMFVSVVDSLWKIIKDFIFFNYKDKIIWKEINGKIYVVIKCKDNFYNVKEKVGVLVLRIVGFYVKYIGFIYIDNVILIVGKKVVLKVERILFLNLKIYYKVKIEVESVSDGWVYSVEKENVKFFGKGYVFLFGNNMGNIFYNIKVLKIGYYIFIFVILIFGFVKDGSIDIWIDGDLKGGVKVLNVKGKFQEVVVRKKIYLIVGEYIILL